MSPFAAVSRILLRRRWGYRRTGRVHQHLSVSVARRNYKVPPLPKVQLLQTTQRSHRGPHFTECPKAQRRRCESPHTCHPASSPG